MVATEQLLLLAGLGAGAYYVLNRDAPHTGSGTGPAPVPGQSPVKNFKQLINSRDAVARAIATGAMQRVVSKKGTGNTGASGSNLPKEVEDQIMKDMKAQWEKATGEAKKAICQRLNAQYNTGLNCENAPNMTFQTLVSVTGAAIGGAVCGPPCSVVGAMVAAWAGPKLEEWAEDAWAKTKEWGAKILPWNW